MKKRGYISYEKACELHLNPYNRKIDLNHVHVLEKEMSEFFEFFQEIIVNIRTNNIIDGQHRVQAFKNLIRGGGYRSILCYLFAISMNR